LKAVTIFRDLFEKDGTNARAHRELGVMTRKAGRLSLKAGNAELALSQYTAANQLTAGMIAADATNAEAVRDMSVGEKGIGDSLAALGRSKDALVYYRGAITRIKGLIDTAPGNAQARGDLALAEGAVGAVLAAINDLPGAALAYQRALAARDELLGDQPTAAAQSEAALASMRLGETLAKLPGRGDESQRHLQRGLETWRVLNRDGKLSPADKQRLADAERSALR
jgi:tetratricopeptide (TPR) repeat protein